MTPVDLIRIIRIAGYECRQMIEASNHPEAAVAKSGCADSYSNAESYALLRPPHWLERIAKSMSYAKRIETVLGDNRYSTRVLEALGKVESHG